MRTIFGLTIGAALLLSCTGRRAPQTPPIALDTLFADSLLMQEEMLEEEELSIKPGQDVSSRIDALFGDFLFAYLHSSALRRQRTDHPLPWTDTTGVTKEVRLFDAAHEFQFLQGDYFTTFYGNSEQIDVENEETQEQDTLVNVQRISFSDSTICNFIFRRSPWEWRLTNAFTTTFDDDELSEFLHFYARFTTDSLFQAQSIANHLHVVLQDPDDDEGIVQGTIDAGQWSSFCPEMPSGCLSNIIRQQWYGGRRILLRKCGLSNSLQEIFTFTRERGNWRLTRYEN